MKQKELIIQLKITHITQNNSYNSNHTNQYKSIQLTQFIHKKSVTLINSMNFLFDVGMSIGPVIGYVHQLRLIQMTKLVGSFSIDICGILLFANILRLNFYIFNQYQLSLFFQSIIMIAVQVILIRTCIKHSQHNSGQNHLQRSASTMAHTEKQQQLWRWKEFSSYAICILVFIISTFALSIFFKKQEAEWYGVILGLVALLSESILILPQIIKNYLTQSTEGLSHLLVVLNLVGDISKLIYFLIKTQPFQFVLCGVIQIVLDSFVIGQIFYYKRLDAEIFQKENKSLVIKDSKHFFQNKKIETQQNLNGIVQMQHIQHIPSPQNYQIQDNTLQTSDVQENQNEPISPKLKFDSQQFNEQRTYNYEFKQPFQGSKSGQKQQQNESGETQRQMRNINKGIKQQKGQIRLQKSLSQNPTSASQIQSKQNEKNSIKSKQTI